MPKYLLIPITASPTNLPASLRKTSPKVVAKAPSVAPKAATVVPPPAPSPAPVAPAPSAPPQTLRTVYEERRDSWVAEMGGVPLGGHQKVVDFLGVLNGYRSGLEVRS